MADTTAPTLTSLTFPTTINLISGSQTLTFTAHAEDAGSGIDDVIVWFDKSLSTDIGAFRLVGIFDGWSDSTPFDGSSTRTVLSADNPGTYTITSIDVTDLAGNTHSYSPSQLTAMGISTSLTIAGNDLLQNIAFTQEVAKDSLNNPSFSGGLS